MRAAGVNQQTGTKTVGKTIQLHDCIAVCDFVSHPEGAWGRQHDETAEGSVNVQIIYMQNYIDEKVSELCSCTCISATLVDANANSSTHTTGFYYK